MSELTPEKSAGQEVPETQTNEEIRAKLLADGVPEEEITPELIAERAEIEGKLDDTAMISGETVEAWRRRILAEAERADTQATGAVEAATTAASEAAEDAIDAAKDAASSAVEGVDEKAAEYIGEKADSWFKGLLKDIPGVSGFLENFSIGEHVQKFVASMLGGFGLGSFFSGLINKILGRDEKSKDDPQEDPVETGGEDNTPTPEQEDPSPEPAENPAATEGEDENNEVLGTESKRNALFVSGSNLIISLNGRSEHSEVDRESIRNGLRLMKYSEIISFTPHGNDLLGDSIASNEASLRDEILEKLKSEDTKTLLRVGLSKQSVENIITPNGNFNDNLSKYFGESEDEGKLRLQTILQQAKNGDENWWQELNYEEISILYIQSIPALRVPVVNGLRGIVGEVQGFFGDINIPEEVDDISIIPRSVIERFAMKYSNTTSNALIGFGSSEELIAKLYEEGETPTNKEREVIEKLFHMQQYLSGGFVHEGKLGLSDEQKELFKQNLDYAGVLSLYAILGGQENIAHLNPVSLPILLWTVSQIIGGNDEVQSSYQSNLYLGNYIRKALTSGNGLGLSDDEEKVLGIYGHKVMDTMLYAHLDGIAKTMGMPAGMFDLDLTELGLGMFVGGFAVNKMGSRLISGGIDRRTISRTGSALRKAGLIGMFAGAVTGGAGFFLEENPMSSFVQDVEGAMSANNGAGDIERLTDILETHNESIREIPMGNGEKMIVSSYPGETPFTIIDGNIYVLNIGPKDIVSAFQDNIDNPSWRSFWNLASRQIPFTQDTGLINDINFNIQSYDQETGNIIFGEGNHTFPISLEEIFTIQEGDETAIGADLLHIFTDGEKQFTEAVTGFIIGEVGNNNILYLHKVGSIES